MKKNMNLQDLEEEISSLGNNLSEIESLAKCIDISLDDEFNYTRRDIENLINVLTKTIERTNQIYEKISELMEL